MQMVLGAARFADERVRLAAYACLCDMSELYYQYLEPFMGDLFQLTGAAIKNEAEDVSMQAIEFWTRIGETELDLIADAAEAEEAGVAPEQPCLNIAKRALQPLLPLLLECLTQQVWFESGLSCCRHYCLTYSQSPGWISLVSLFRISHCFSFFSPCSLPPTPPLSATPSVFFRFTERGFRGRHVQGRHGRLLPHHHCLGRRQ